jgi:protein-export membrane protein SecD
MPSKRKIFWPILTCILAFCILTVALPDSSKKWAPGFLRSPAFHLGLDLAGGTQLDFRISEREMQDQIDALRSEIAVLEKEEASPEKIGQLQIQLQSIEQQQNTVVEAIRTVLERRINALGVSEAIITPSYIGNEKHLLVECPGAINTQECIKNVGKTIQLEFKEEFTEPTEEFENSVHELVATAKRRIAESGATLSILGEDLGSEIGIAFADNATYFQDELPEGLEDLWDLPESEKALERRGSVSITDQDQDGKPYEREIPGIFLAEVTGARTQTGRLISDATSAFTLLVEQEGDVSHATHENKELGEDVSTRIIATLRSMQSGELKPVDLDDGSARILFLRTLNKGEESMDASHILISYKGADSAGEDVSRTKKEALAKAQQIHAELTQGGIFEDVAKRESDGPSGEDGGSLGSFNRGMMVSEFEIAAFNLEEGTTSPPIETKFGYHIIRSDKAPVRANDHASFDELIVEGENSLARAEDMVQRLKSGEVRRQEEVAHISTLFFSLIPSGWKDTLLDGKHFRTATVTLDPSTNLPIVQITFDAEGAKLFQELTRDNVDKRIAIFVGGQLVSAPTVQTEIVGGTAIITGSRNFEEARTLAQALNTGAIPAPIYLTGQRTVEATLGATALKTSMKAALIGLMILMVYMLLVYRFLGLLADIALSIYAVIFLALLKLPLFLFSDQYIVLTLAGMAGIILSIGMAVDANVLIFERVKEELRKGKMLSTAIETGFQRAWPSIRDGNVSTFLTCAILFTIGTSIVRGFAVTLGMGIILSMFSAIVITRWLLRLTAATSIGEKRKLFCA